MKELTKVVRLKGFIAVIISGIIFGCMPLVAKIIFMNGGNSISLVFYRFLFALPALYLMNKKQKISMKITQTELKRVAILSLFGYSATAVLLFLSYNYIPTGLATTVHFIYPVFVTIGCIVFFREKFSFIKILCAFLCTFGITLLLRDAGINSNINGLLLAFSSGITYAFYMIYIEKSTLRDMPPFKLTFYICLVSSGILFIFSIFTKTFTTQMSSLGWILTIILSIIVAIGAVALLQIGISIIGSQSAAILSTFEPITSVIIGIIIFDEPLNFKVLLGIAIIISSVILLAIESNKGAKEKCCLQASED